MSLYFLDSILHPSPMILVTVFNFAYIVLGQNIQKSIFSLFCLLSLSPWSSFSTSSFLFTTLISPFPFTIRSIYSLWSWSGNSSHCYVCPFLSSIITWAEFVTTVFRPSCFFGLLRFHHIPIIIGSTCVSVVTFNYSILFNLPIGSIIVIESSHMLHIEDRLIVRILSNSRRGRGRPFMRTA